MRINRHLVRALLSACLLVVCYFATSERASAQGPVILMGIDAEDGWPSHGSPDIYAGIINTGILSNIAPLLVFAQVFWSSALARAPLTM